MPHLHHGEVIIDLLEEGRGQIEWEKLHRQKKVGRETYTTAGVSYMHIPA